MRFNWIFIVRKYRARICRSFKGTRYRFSAWRAGTIPYLSYWPARLHRLAKSIPRNRCLGSINFYKYGFRSVCTSYITDNDEGVDDCRLCLWPMGHGLQPYHFNACQRVEKTVESETPLSLYQTTIVVSNPRQVNSIKNAVLNWLICCAWSRSKRPCPDRLSERRTRGLFWT